jgi:hypothetical protein
MKHYFTISHPNAKDIYLNLKINIRLPQIDTKKNLCNLVLIADNFKVKVVQVRSN